MPKPVVTGITALGIDHVSVLGGTLKEIAWHKAGIYKVGSLLSAAHSSHKPCATGRRTCLDCRTTRGRDGCSETGGRGEAGVFNLGLPQQLYLILRKASRFSVVERIPEMDEIKLGEAALRNSAGWATLTQTFRTRRISPISKCRAGRGTLPGVLEIPS